MEIDEHGVDILNQCNPFKPIGNGLGNLCNPF